MHHEIIQDCVIRNVKFVKGQIVIEGDFPPSEFEKHIKAGFVARHDDKPATLAKPADSIFANEE